METKEIISWIDANGTEYVLTDQEDMDISIGPGGRYMPPVETTDEDVPFHHGSRPRNTKVKPREMDFPCEIYGKTKMDIRIKLRSLLKIFNPLRGNGKIKSVSPDGSQREIECRYQGGLEINESVMIKENFVIVLKAFDPFWYDTSTNVFTFNTGQPATFFPFFPLRLSSSTVFADTTIDNLGDVEAWPEWIITGPGENIVLRNLTTGNLLNLNVSLSEGESVTIITKPFQKSVKKNDGANLYGEQSDDSSLWPLREGKNNVRIEMSNATNESSVQLSYRNGYLGV